MHRTESPLVAVAACLAALAGFVDALAFTSLGGFFASFMSGNATRLGVGLGHGRGGEALIAGGLILSFVSGVIVASVIVRVAGARHKSAVMAAVAALLFAAASVAALVPGPLALLLLATAMGGAHLLFHRIGAAPFTVALVRMAEGLAGALMGDADRRGWPHELLLLAAFGAGAAMGARAQVLAGIQACWLGGLIAVVLALWLTLIEQRGVGAQHPRDLLQ